MTNYVQRYHRVYLLDDHDIVRRGVRDLLVQARDIDIVGDSGSAQGSVPEILRLETDVMLLDLQLQDGTGVEVCRAVRAVNPAITGLLLTAAGDDQALAATVLAGASGYLVKLTRTSDIVKAIRDQQAGRAFLDEESVLRGSALLASVLESLTPPATSRERDILERILAGQTDREIRAALALEDHHDGPDVVEFVTRMTEALLAPGGSPGAPGTGRHRRAD
jgi:two-component system response regulator DevR